MCVFFYHILGLFPDLRFATKFRTETRGEINNISKAKHMWVYCFENRFLKEHAAVVSGTWNRLPTELKLLRSTHSFRRDLKTFPFCLRSPGYGLTLWCALGLGRNTSAFVSYSYSGQWSGQSSGALWLLICFTLQKHLLTYSGQWSLVIGRHVSIKPISRTCGKAGPMMMTSLVVDVVESVYKQCVNCTTMTHKHPLLRHRRYVTTVMTSLRLATASVSRMRPGLFIAPWVVCLQVGLRALSVRNWTNQIKSSQIYFSVAGNNNTEYKSVDFKIWHSATEGMDGQTSWHQHHP